jgi:hypothetical protein
MSFPKKRTRTVDVDNKTYRYLISGLFLFIQEDCKNPGRLLSVNMDNVFPASGTNGGLGPGDVRKIILLSIANGWSPSEKGAPFISKVTFNQDDQEKQGENK